MVAQLAYAGYAYGDWKAENIAWINVEGEDVLQAIDFGHMCALGTAGPWGTDCCMAPEVGVMSILFLKYFKVVLRRCLLAVPLPLLRKCILWDALCCVSWPLRGIAESAMSICA